jgi:GNAT superfamily N-acetyltransferase
MADAREETDLVRRAMDVDHLFLALGHETFEAEGARFVRDRDYPGIHDANHVSRVSADTPEAVERLFVHADREFAHCAHRLFLLDAQTPPAVEAVLLLHGYERSDSLFLLLPGGLAGTAPPHDVRALEGEEGWAAYTRLKRRDWDEVALRLGLHGVAWVGAEMARVHRRKSPPVRYWLAYVDGQPRGFMASLVGADGVGQVEDLYVEPEVRHRGLATALIHRAVADCRARGAGPVLIVADASDTPKTMYAAMGFRPLAVEHKYLLRLAR